MSRVGDTRGALGTALVRISGAVPDREARSDLGSTVTGRGVAAARGDSGCFTCDDGSTEGRHDRLLLAAGRAVGALGVRAVAALGVREGVEGLGDQAELLALGVRDGVEVVALGVREGVELLCDQLELLALGVREGVELLCDQLEVLCDELEVLRDGLEVLRDGLGVLDQLAVLRDGLACGVDEDVDGRALLLEDEDGRDVVAAGARVPDELAEGRDSR